MDYNWPSGKDFCPVFFEMEMRPNVQIEMSGYNGGIQTSEIPGSRWVAKMQLARSPKTESTQVIREAYFSKVRGPVNRIVMGHLGHPSPAGTLSGSIVSQGALQGAQTMMLTGTGAPAVGDMLIVTTTSGPQWIQVNGVAPGSGECTITFSAPLRAAVEASSTVLYLNTTTRWVVMGSGVPIGFGAEFNPEVALDLMEVWN